MHRWEAYLDSRTKLQYYVNATSGERTWEAPSELVLPPGWLALFDPHQQRNYFVHVQSGTTTWQRPEPGSLPRNFSDVAHEQQRASERRSRQAVPAGAPRRETDSGKRRSCDAISANVVAERIRSCIIRRNGSLGIQRLAEVFQRGDTSGDSRLDPTEFRLALESLQVYVNEDDLNALFSYFDRDRDGTLNAEEFIAGLRCMVGVSTKRAALLTEAFDRIQSGDGVLTASDLRLSFDPKYLPDVISGRRDIEDGANEFLLPFETQAAKGNFTEEAFATVYRNISAAIESDTAFEHHLRQCWPGFAHRAERRDEQMHGQTPPQGSSHETHQSWHERVNERAQQKQIIASTGDFVQYATSPPGAPQRGSGRTSTDDSDKDHVAQGIHSPMDRAVDSAGSCSHAPIKPSTPDQYSHRTASDACDESWADTLAQCISNGTRFTDHTFPADGTSLYGGSGRPYHDGRGETSLARATRWRRISEIIAERDLVPALFDFDVSAGDVVQGALGDCYFLGALSVLASQAPTRLKDTLFPNLPARHAATKRVVVSTSPSIPSGDRLESCLDELEQVYNPCGIYAVRFFREGAWRQVVIDDFLPCGEDGLPVFARWTSPAASQVERAVVELWVCLAEKAYAKLNGSYAAIVGGQEGDALQVGVDEVDSRSLDLTAGISLRLQWSKPRCPEERVEMLRYTEGHGGVGRLFSDLLAHFKRGDLMCASTTKPEARQHGVQPGHAYGITDVRRLNGIETRGEDIRLVQLRNPWGRGFEFNGDWSDKSSKWHQYPKVAANLGIRDAEDGVFWMSAEDFHSLYCMVALCIPPPDTDLPCRRRGHFCGGSNPDRAGSKTWFSHRVVADWSGETAKFASLSPQVHVRPLLNASSRLQAVRMIVNVGQRSCRPMISDDPEAARRAAGSNASPTSYFPLSLGLKIARNAGTKLASRPKLLALSLASDAADARVALGDEDDRAATAAAATFGRNFIRSTPVSSCKGASRTNDGDLIVDQRLFFRAREFAREVVLQPQWQQAPFALIPSNLEPGVESKFFVTIFSDAPLEVRVTKEDSEIYVTQLRRRVVACLDSGRSGGVYPNAPKSWWRCPQHVVEIVAAADSAVNPPPSVTIEVVLDQADPRGAVTSGVGGLPAIGFSVVRLPALTASGSVSSKSMLVGVGPSTELERTDRVLTSAISPVRFVASTVELKIGARYVILPFAFVPGTAFHYSLSLYLNQPTSGGRIIFSDNTLELAVPGAQY